MNKDGKTKLTINEIKAYWNIGGNSPSDESVSGIITSLFKDGDAQEVINTLIENCHTSAGRQVSLSTLRRVKFLKDMDIKKLIEYLCTFAVVEFIDLHVDNGEKKGLVALVRGDDSVDEEKLKNIKIILKRALETSILFNHLYCITSEQKKELEQVIKDEVSRAERDYLGKTTQMAGIVIAIFSLVGFNLLNIINSNQMALRELLSINFTILFAVIIFFGCLRLFILEKKTENIFKGASYLLRIVSVTLMVISVVFAIQYIFMVPRVVNYGIVFVISLIIFVALLRTANKLNKECTCTK